MPRVHFVKAARKDNPRCGVKAGESYYYWKNRSPGQRAGVLRCSKVKPRPSQIQGNPFRARILEIEEQIEDDLATVTIMDDLEGMTGDWVNEIESLRDEEQEKFDNLPQNFQDGGSGEIIQARIDALDTWRDEFDNWIAPGPPDECEEGDDDCDYDELVDDQLTEAMDELRSFSFQG